MQTKNGAKTVDELLEENQMLREEVRVARKAGELTAELVAVQFEETDRLLNRFQEANSQRKAVLNAATKLSIISSDLDGRITLFNTGAENLLGYKAEEAMDGMAPLDLISEREVLEKALKLSKSYGRPIDWLEMFVDMAKSGMNVESEWTYVRKDRTYFPVSMTVTLVKDNEGNVNGILFVAQDITERKRAEKEILDAMRAAEDANRTKSAFLANMSHELRTPLNAIIGYSEMLMEEAEDLDVEEFIPDLSKIRSAGKHLLALINDILDLSKIEAGKMDLYLEDFNLSEVVADVKTTVYPLVEKNSNTLKVNSPDEIGAVHADMTRVRQVLFNLLSNACKFTDNGTISLDVRREERDGSDWIFMDVRDSGIGMTEQQQKNLFQAFSQADASTTRKYGGTGLGLAISRRFCNMMGGDITVASEVGKGTMFTASFPAVVEKDSVEDAIEAPGAEKARDEAAGFSEAPNQVLLIDDEEVVHDLIRRTLEKEGFRVVSAYGGEEGLALVRELKPIAVLLDVMMPGMDGWAVIKELKADPDTRDIPVVMTTMVDERGIGFALGAADYMVKPVDKERLIEVLDKYKLTDEPGSVLVVEDDPSNRELLCRMLRKEGWEAIEAKNGREGMDVLSGRIPDMILLDLMMPVMDGFEFAAEMKKNEDWKKIPIVVVTAKEVTAEDRERLNGGVMNILQKGAYDREKMLSIIKDEVIKHTRARQ